MAESPVVLLQGPRSVGKSTLLQILAGQCGGRVVDLDDPAVRAAVSDDPGLLVSGPGPVFIDEYQHVPVLLDSIKAELNRDGSPGRFVLAGSTRFESLPLASQSLTDRLHRLEILPLSPGEIGGAGGERGGSRENVVEALLGDPGATVSPGVSVTTRHRYAEIMVRGGFPFSLARTEAARARWFDDYLARCERELLGEGRVRRPSAGDDRHQALMPLLARLASQTARVLDASSAGRAVGLAAGTASDYVKLFEAAFLVRLLPAWGTTLSSVPGYDPEPFSGIFRGLEPLLAMLPDWRRKRRSVTRHCPKLHLVDSGLAARLLRLPPDELSSLDLVALHRFGHLLKTFVVGEVLKQASWMEHPPYVGYWRTHDGGVEVDIVVEDARDGSVVGIEVKPGSRIRRDAPRSLRKLREVLGYRFTAGVVLYTGPRCIRYKGVDAGIIALPIDRLWAGATP